MEKFLKIVRRKNQKEQADEEEVNNLIATVQDQATLLKMYYLIGQNTEI